MTKNFQPDHTYQTDGIVRTRTFLGCFTPFFSPLGLSNHEWQEVHLPLQIERRTAKHKKCQTRFFAHIFSCNSPRHLRYTTKVSGSGEEKNGKKTIRFFSINGLDRDPKLTITHSFIPFTFPFFSCVSECHCPTALLFTPYIWRRIESGGFKRIPECNDQRTGSVLSPLGHAVPWSVYL